MQINETRFKNSFSCGKYILEKHGMCGMRRGMLITLFREVPAFAGYFGMYDLMVNDVLGYQYTGVQSRNCDSRQKFVNRVECVQTNVKRANEKMLKIWFETVFKIARPFER